MKFAKFIRLVDLVWNPQTEFQGHITLVMMSFWLKRGQSPSFSLYRHLISFPSYAWFGVKPQNRCWIYSQTLIGLTTFSPAKTIKHKPNTWLCISQLYRIIVLQLFLDNSSPLSLIHHPKYVIEVLSVAIKILKCLCEIEFPSTRSGDQHKMVCIRQVVRCVVLWKWRRRPSFRH